ncbi:MAG: Hpt domain-containing protein [Endozoicomonadaceae bacterium]|nr:Hpt domain-containing protein [Endozoicomonadaceae bacterium]
MSIMDFSILEQFCELLGDDDKTEVNDLIQIYLADTPKQLAMMDNSLKIQDLEAFKRAAHSLKSSCANVGAIEFSQWAQSLESMNTIASPELQNELNIGQTHFKQTTDKLKQWLLS